MRGSSRLWAFETIETTSELRVPREVGSFDTIFRDGGSE